MYGQAYKALVEKTKDTTGARVENNKFCLSVHFRCVDEKVILPRPAVRRLLLHRVLQYLSFTRRRLPLYLLVVVI